jgi:hypothetical protein
VTIAPAAPDYPMPSTAKSRVLFFCCFRRPRAGGFGIRGLIGVPDPVDAWQRVFGTRSGITRQATRNHATPYAIEAAGRHSWVRVCRWSKGRRHRRQ